MNALPTIDDFLDQLKRVKKIPTDYALADHFGIQQATISSWRKGRTLPDEVWCVRLAKEIGLEPGYVLACVAAERSERAKRPEVAETWRHMAEKMGVLSIAIAIYFALPLLDYTQTSSAVAATEHCILCQIAQLALWLALELLFIVWVFDNPRPNNNKIRGELEHGHI